VKMRIASLTWGHAYGGTGFDFAKKRAPVPTFSAPNPKKEGKTYDYTKCGGETAGETR
jgi:hypothetical protein